MNLDRTIGNIFPKFPALDVKRLLLMTLIALGLLVFLIWSFSEPVKAQTGEFFQQFFTYPAAMTVHPPLLSDPVIDRLAGGAQVSADGRTVVFSGEGEDCRRPCQPGIILEDLASASRENASLGLYGAPADAEAVHPSISRDGSLVVFSSPASNLVTKDTNVASDIFLYDRSARQIRRISLGTAGAQAEGDSYEPSLSANGRFVTFVSYAENLTAGDTNKKADVFLADLEQGTMRRLSVNPFGGQANRDAHQPVISADGKIVAFSSSADNLVAEDTNAAEDVFAVSVDTGEIMRLSMAADGGQTDGDSFDPALSADGRLLAFASYADNLSAVKNAAANVFLYDSQTQQTRCVSCDAAQRAGAQAAWKPRFAPDGRLLLFDMLVPADAAGTPNLWQVYGYDCEHDLVYRLAASESADRLED